MTKVIQKFLLATILSGLQLTALAAPAQKVMKRVVYGKSTLGQKLVGHLIYYSGDFSSRKAVVVTDGIHGNEYMGIADELARDWGLKSGTEVEAFLRSGGMLIIAPQLNPDGIKLGKRLEARGEDLNRDFNPHHPQKFLSRPESFYLADWVEKTLKEYKAQLVFAMDYHCCANALIFAQVEQKGKEQMYSEFSRMVFDSLKANFDRKFKMGVTREIFGYATIGTLKDYWATNYGAASFTFEGSTPSTEIKDLDGHRQWWKKIFGMVTQIAPVQLAQMSRGLAPAVVASGRKSDFRPYSE